MMPGVGAGVELLGVRDILPVRDVRQEQFAGVSRVVLLTVTGG